jgi:hypothetical protein
MKGDFKMKVETLLKEEITSQIEEIAKMDLGSEQCQIAVNNVTKLTDQYVELKKIESENDLKLEEIALKREQIEGEKKGRTIQIILGVGGIIVPAVLTIWGTKASFEFEKEGTITTIMGRGFINKLIPRR